MACGKVYFEQLFDFPKSFLLFLLSLKMCHIRNTEQLFDTPLKPWLKSKSFGSIFFHLAKVFATTYIEPELALMNDDTVNPEVFARI